MEACTFPSRLRLGVTLIIVLIVISSPLVMLVNPSLIAAPLSKERSGTDAAPSTISQEGDFTAQAPLQIPRTLQSNDLVNSLAFYEVTFITSTTGAIDKIRMDFPAGTNIAAAGVIEKVGIGGGTLLKSGSSITYDVTTPVSIPAGTFIRLEIFGIKNPGITSTSFTATLTTRDSGGNLIDGPSTTNVYTIKQIGTNDIADNSITPTKPSEGFMKDVTVTDTTNGHAIGWDPDGLTTSFEISEQEILSFGTFIKVEVRGGDNINRNCDTISYSLSLQTFIIQCASAPPNNAVLHYVVQNLPSQIIS